MSSFSLEASLILGGRLMNIEKAEPWCFSWFLAVKLGKSLEMALIRTGNYEYRGRFFIMEKG
jgi:hypothetical protein